LVVCTQCQLANNEEYGFERKAASKNEPFTAKGNILLQREKRPVFKGELRNPVLGYVLE
jgi:hypothetical protein